MTQFEQTEEIAESLKEQGYQGLDVNLDIALFDYGLVTKELKDNRYKIIYEYGPNKYCYRTVNNNLIDDIINSKWVDLDGVLSFTGMDQQQWKNQSFLIKLFDLLQYYGPLDILGDTYNSYSIEEIYNKEV